MTDTTSGPGITEGEVTGWSKEPSSPNLKSVVAAVNGYVSGLPVVQHLEPAEAWPADVQLGALMLAARLIKRRNSPNGIEAATDLNVTYTARYDSDISRLLKLDGHRTPAVG